MAETNGSGRLDRIEATLDRMIEHHEREFKSLLQWQVLMQDKMDAFDKRFKAEEDARRAENRLMDARADKLDARVDKLVLSIGELIKQMQERLPR